jgi:RNA polymerase sigma factor (sigma-70 family)
MDEQKWLEEFASHGCEQAFQHLLDRYQNLVLSTAMRQLRNRDDAKDVFQQVFSLLATQASRLQSHVSLAGWLYRTTCNLALKQLRREGRRWQREKEASQIMGMANNDTPEWNSVAPHLESAMMRLSEKDRLCLLLRYFQGIPLREVGKTLALSEDAARMRAHRALEKLRISLKRDGIMVAAVHLANLLAGNAVQAAPLEIAAAIRQMTFCQPRAKRLAKTNWSGLTGHRPLMWYSGGMLVLGLLLLVVGLGLYNRHQTKLVVADHGILNSVSNNSKQADPKGTRFKSGVASPQPTASEHSGDEEPLITMQMSPGSIPGLLNFYRELTRRKLILETPALSGSINLVIDQPGLKRIDAIKLLEDALRAQCNLLLIHLDNERSFVVRADPEWERIADTYTATSQTGMQDGQYRGKSIHAWVELTVSSPPQNKEASLMVMALGAAAEPLLIDGLDKSLEVSERAQMPPKAAWDWDARQANYAFWLGRVEPLSQGSLLALCRALTNRAPINQTAADSLLRIMQRNKERLPEFKAMLPQLRALAATTPSVSLLIRYLEDNGRPRAMGFPEF